ncbi:MAG TPA: hypothetical protein VFV10_16620 [Gammaproteobacteria bacterium]|nr:hypothetical protein [Gammaproteobacteria bacterium]
MQLAAGVALLAGAGLLTTSFYRIERRGPGFDPDGVWSASVALPEVRAAAAARKTLRRAPRCRP